MPRPEFQGMHARAAQSVPVPPHDHDRVLRMLAREDYKGALEMAKHLHQKINSCHSERLLVEAYVGRIAGLRSQGLGREADALRQVVQERYPSARERLDDERAAGAALAGDLDELLRRLADPALPADRRASLESVLRRALRDPAALAQSPVLTAAHPLARSAGAVAAAFAAATTRLVTDEEIALPEISHRSPLAPWKSLVRAVACYYRCRDDLCARHLESVDPRSGPAPLARVLRRALGERSGVPPAESERGREAALLAAIVDGRREMLCEIEKLEKALSARDALAIAGAAASAVGTCRQLAPDVHTRLSQRILARLRLADLPGKTCAAVGEVAEDASLWRLLAHAAEQKGYWCQACECWARFVRRGPEEGLFAQKSPEAAAVYLHMLDLLPRVPEEALRRARLQWRSEQAAFERKGAAGPGGCTTPRDTYFLWPAEVFERAARADPDPETFRRWFDWTRAGRSSVREVDRVAQVWHAALPGDVRPLLHLIAASERRKAYTKALEYLNLAERADPVDPAVRRARLRTRYASILRRLGNRKAHLTGEDFVALRTSPEAVQGDRPAMTAALAWADAIVRADVGVATRMQAEVVRLIGGEVGAHALFGGIAGACGISITRAPAASPEGGNVAQLARACALGRDAGIRCALLPEWDNALVRELSAPAGAIDGVRLRALAEAAIVAGRPVVAYAAAGAGLRQGGPSAARFLLLRGRSLQAFGWESRRAECVRAAAELARRQGDRDTAEEANRMLAEAAPAFAPARGRAASRGAPVDEAQRILERETASSLELESAPGNRRRERSPEPPFLPGPDLEPEDEGVPDGDDLGFGPLPSPEDLEKMLDAFFSRRRGPRRRRGGPRPPF